MGYQAVPAQRELFPAVPTRSLPPEVTQRLLLLVEQLLGEAAVFNRAAAEQGDEQDHA
jgi:hypothetical protein